ncbi:MAG: Holliday junction resolvase RuvX [Myxococcota bacterium]|nr:Holliday junction resolvase RuvX [Myxococcota bacterium]
MTVLGIDLGARRIGLAVSDAEDRIAFPAGVIASKGPKADVGAVAELARERDVRAVVVGLPIHMDGREGPEAKAARQFAERLAERSGLPVELLDERWTSREAERVLAGSTSRRKGRRDKGRVDEAAATILLRTWLERQPTEGPR